MKKSIGYRLFRIGKMPVALQEIAAGGTALVSDEGVSIKFSARGLRAPGRYISRGVKLHAGAVVVTADRVALSIGKRVVLDLKYGDEKRAVIEGLANTGRVITSAAAIMVCVFTSFVLNGDPVVKEFGVGLAVAIAIDSTLVRCLLVPAVMVLLGKRAWWLPGWMDRIVPHISIEGEEFFAARDAKLAADGPKAGHIGPKSAHRPD